jgi:hypothetical protein
MKITFFSLAILALFSCASKKIVPKTELPVVKASTCFENGNCTAEIFKNTELLIRKDETGQLYVEIIPGVKNVFKYSYTRKKLEGIADSGYQEIVLFEFLSGEINLHLQDKNLQEANLVFGRFCYCKGESGYFRINRGNLKLVSYDKNVTVDLKFQAEVPQIIHELKETIKQD